MPFSQVHFDADATGSNPGKVNWRHLAAATLILVAAFAAVRILLLRFAGLTESAYSEPVITIALLTTRLNSVLWLAVVAATVAWLIGTKAHRLTWSSSGIDARLRGLAVILSAILAWKFSTYGFNLYFDQWHLVDRALLIFLLPLIWLRPVAILPFLVVLLAIQNQYNYPIGGYSWAVESLPIQVLMLFLVALIAGPVGRRAGLDRALPTAMVLVLLSIYASNYWGSGISKLMLNWYLLDQVHFLVPAGYANGWMAGMDSSVVGRMAEVMSRFDGPIRLVTFVLECGAIAFVVRRRLSIGLAGAWAVFHLGIFAASGILFWMWIVADATLLILLVRNGGFAMTSVFRPAAVPLSMILIASSVYWLNPVSLRWYDSRITYKYTFEAIGETGTAYELLPEFFSPSDYAISLSGVSYLTQESVLPVAFGATGNRDLAERLNAAESLSDLSAAEDKFGIIRYDRGRAERLTNFLAVIGGRNNNRLEQPVWPRWLKAPPSIWIFAREQAYRGQEPIASIRVKQIVSAYLKGEIHTIREVLIEDIPISDASADRTPE